MQLENGPIGLDCNMGSVDGLIPLESAIDEPCLRDDFGFWFVLSGVHTLVAWDGSRSKVAAYEMCWELERARIVRVPSDA